MSRHLTIRSIDLRTLLAALPLVAGLITLLALVIQPNAGAAGGAVPGIGIKRWGNSYSHGTGYQRYSYVNVATGDAPAAGSLATDSLVYMSGTSIQTTWSTGVSYQEALASGWLLKDASGNYLRNVAYGAYVGDFGNPAYQQRFVDNVAAFLSANGNEGVFIDDVIGSPEGLTGGAYPVKYPTQQAWEDAQVAFVQSVGQGLRARGFYVLVQAFKWIAGHPGSNDGSLNSAFFARLAPHVSGVQSEYWMQDPTDLNRLRAAGSDWYQQWDAWLNLAGVTQAAGADFFAMMYGSTSSTAIMRYGRASFLLGWDGSGGAFTYEVESSDPWNTEWTVDIGQPSGGKYQVGVGWRRDYSGGTVVLNPSPGSSQTFSLGGTYTRADGTSVTSVTLAPTSALVLKRDGAPPPPPPPSTPPVNTALPAITGSAQQGATLAASTGSWSNSPTGYAYQWKRCDTAGANCSSLSGGTGQQYVLGAGDVGKRMRVTVTASNASGSASATSNPTGVVSSAPPPPPPPPPNAVPPVNTALPAITGTAQEGVTLSASTGNWSNSPTGYAYQWKRCDSAGANCTPIAGSTGSQHTLGAASVGKTLRITVTASNGAGSASATSNATPVVAPAPAPKPPKIDVRPTISGTAQEGLTLTATTGTWSNSPRWYAFQWRRCNTHGGGCVDIGGATDWRYVVASGDVGHSLRVVVAASNDGGVSYARTDQTAGIAPRNQGMPPEVSTRPTIGGMPREGIVIAVTTGTWSNSPSRYAFQWRRCNVDGLACVSIDGATEAQRVLTDADVGWTLRVVVAASNESGTAYARTDATAVVAPRPVARPPAEPGG